MIFKPTPLSGSYEIEMTPFKDERGWFGRFYCKEEFTSIGHDKEWVQMNHSFTVLKGSLRGMHFQKPPYGEIKMVRCIAGKVFDVIVDLRKDSPTFLKWTAIELSAEKMNLVYIPAGFAHGFQTLENNCELIYFHSEFYRPDAESGLKYDDPAIGIEWPVDVVQISARDRNHSPIDNNFKGIY
jgi:dTDP-4-dehydrorhamnose 3,5-epimerase